MRILFYVFLLSLGAILLAVGAMWWRLRWHLRRSNDAMKEALADIQQQDRAE